MKGQLQQIVLYDEVYLLHISLIDFSLHLVYSKFSLTLVQYSCFFVLDKLPLKRQLVLKTLHMQVGV